MSLRLRLIFAALMSLLMSCVMSAWVTWLHLGFSNLFVERWLSAFATAWPAAFVIVVCVAEPVQRLARRLASWTMA